MSSSTKVEQYTTPTSPSITFITPQWCCHSHSGWLRSEKSNTDRLDGLDGLDRQLLSASGGVQQILAVEFYPKISSNLTGSCQLETLISLTFKPLRKKKLNKFCKQFI